LGSEPILPKTFVCFYKAVVMNVLLYGSESWKVTEQTMGILESFHNKCVRAITRQPVRQEVVDGELTWVQHPIAPLLAKTNLTPIAEYIRARKANLTASYQGKRPEERVDLSNRSYVLNPTLLFDDV
jgi:hypothetical protein